MLLGILGAYLLENMFVGKGSKGRWTIRDNETTIRTGKDF